MKIGEAESWLRNELTPLYDKDEAAAISALVLEHVTGNKKSERMVNREQVLTATQTESLEQMAQQLAYSTPVQYVLGIAPFYGMILFVNPSVLIPRPETEELVAWIIADVKAKSCTVFENTTGKADATDRCKILDVGTGSGCIALALKKEMPLAEVWGCDMSDEALNVARRNGSQLDIRVDFQGVNFLDAAQQKGLPTVDIVVSNPPYIPVAQKDSLHANVVKHEPHEALFVPDNDALVFYKALALFGQHRLYNGGAIYCEIHEDAGKAVIQLFESEGYNTVCLKKDMQGKDRMLKAVKA